MNIDTDFKFDDLALIVELKRRKSPFLVKIQEIFDQVKDILDNRIQYVFPNYTLHNTGHSYRIMEYMSKLVNDISKLNDLEITLLVYSALLHDIGMAVSEDDIVLIKTDSFSFCDVKFSAMKKLRDEEDSLVLQEYVRRIHASLSGKYIRENLKDKLVMPKLINLDFAEELALICQSHTENYDWIKVNLTTNEVRGDYSFNSQFIAVILRLADILDIDSNRTPYNLYRLISPKGISDLEWKQHFIISNNDKIIFNEKTQQKKIVFHGKAKNANVHRKILTYINWVKEEITNATILVNPMLEQYSLIYDTNPEINIKTEGYTFSDYKMTLEFKAISSLLMGEKIYGSKSLGLRELIQNSIDSCRVRQETEQLNYEFGQDVYIPRIKIILDKNKNQVIIKDNGTGMSMEIIKKHFLNIGVSYYNSTDFLLKDFNYRPIGNFGIGFLSCFMLSNEVKVQTRHYKGKNKYLVELERGNEWTSLTETEDVAFEGTEVILNYSDFLKVFDDDIQKIKTFLDTYFLTDNIEFQLIDKFAKSISEIVNPIVLSSLNKGVFKIDLKDYILDVQGYVLVKPKNEFIKKFDEISFSGTLYTYDEEEGLIEVRDFSLLNIDDYINDKEIKYYAIPLIDYDVESDFLNGMKYTEGDIDEVIDKMDRELTWISVILPKDYQESLYDEEIKDDNGFYEKFGFNELVEIGHSEQCITKAYVRKITLFEGRKNNLYLPFDTIDRESYYSLRSSGKRKELFLRSVLIKDFRFNIPISASIFEISSIVVNLNSRKFIPDISRNNFDYDLIYSINYIIGKAIHLGVKDVFDLNQDEKTTLQNFIDTFYSDKTNFEIL